jgi:hypothetical protein
VLPEKPRVESGKLRMIFGFDDKLYLFLSGRRFNSSLIYQIDPKSKKVRHYLGNKESGIDNNQEIHYSAFTLDEKNTLYYFANCTPGSFVYGEAAVKIVKVPQLEDGTAGQPVVIAGNCLRGKPVGEGEAAVDSPVSSSWDVYVSSIVAWNNGEVIYFAQHGVGTYKIVGGKIYSTSISSQTGDDTLFYHPLNKKLYVATGKILEVVPPGNPMIGGESETIIVEDQGTGACLADGLTANDNSPSGPCVATQISGISYMPDGTLIFGDGSNAYSRRKNRIRYVDRQGKIRTLAGTLPFFGDGLDKRLVRGTFSGIFYKKSGGSNMDIFPEGLYFVDPFSLVFGYVRGSDQKVEILGGNQQGRTVEYIEDGVKVNPELNFGSRYWSGNMHPITFLSDGLPRIRYHHFLAKIDENMEIVNYSDQSWKRWNNASRNNTGSARAYTLHVTGGMSNLTFGSDNGLFLLGTHVSIPNPYERVQIKYMDFANNKVIHIMGAPDAPEDSPDLNKDPTRDDEATPGELENLSLDAHCEGYANCYTRFLEVGGEERLYFSENKSFRFIKNVLDTENNSLHTLFTGPSAIGNFIFSEDKGKLFYVMKGQLYCRQVHDAEGPDWCNDSAPLGPPSGLATIASAPDQLTWKDDRTLLISNFRGDVYEFEFPE